MSLVITLPHNGGFRIGDEIFVQLKADKKGRRSYVTALIDAPPDMKVSRLTNNGIWPERKGESEASRGES
jgi:hypothetical protein